MRHITAACKFAFTCRRVVLKLTQLNTRLLSVPLFLFICILFCAEKEWHRMEVMMMNFFMPASSCMRHIWNSSSMIFVWNCLHPVNCHTILTLGLPPSFSMPLKGRSTVFLFFLFSFQFFFGFVYSCVMLFRIEACAAVSCVIFWLMGLQMAHHLRDMQLLL